MLVRTLELDKVLLEESDHECDIGSVEGELVTLCAMERLFDRVFVVVGGTRNVMEREIDDVVDIVNVFDDGSESKLFDREVVLLTERVCDLVGVEVHLGALNDAVIESDVVALTLLTLVVLREFPVAVIEPSSFDDDLVTLPAVFVCVPILDVETVLVVDI